MIKHRIDLNEFKPKGHVACEYRDNLLYMTTNRTIPTQHFDAEHLSINSCIYLSDKYKLPLRIDLTAKIDEPGLYILFGEGHINVGTNCSDNRRLDDFIAPTRKTQNFHNHINMNEFTDISVLYDLKEMQILINGEERYYSKKEKYMKSPTFSERNEEGFELKLACDKLVNLCIKEVCITEYENSCGIIHSEAELPPAATQNYVAAPGEKLTFDKYISNLPKCFQDEILKIDEYLKSLKNLKIKRILEKNGNKITYVASDYGFSYAIYLNHDTFGHSLQWYIITSGKPETWHRKANMMEETLNRLDKHSPEIADRMFTNLMDCVECYNTCLAKTRYQFKDKQKIACHGKLAFKMSEAGFEDVRMFVDEINRIVQETES